MGEHRRGRALQLPRPTGLNGSLGTAAVVHFDSRVLKHAATRPTPPRPRSATTHTDLELRARSQGILVRARGGRNASPGLLPPVPALSVAHMASLQHQAHPLPPPQVRVVHNASIMNAVGSTGLQLYRFGEAVSIVFFTGGDARGGAGPRQSPFATDAYPWPQLAHCPSPTGRGGRATLSCCRHPTLSWLPGRLTCCPAPAPALLPDTWRPDSFYDRIAANRRAGLHTLCLLDIKVSAWPRRRLMASTRCGCILGTLPARA